MATIAQLIACREQLRSTSDSPALDVEYLLCHCLQQPRSYLRGWPEREVEPAVEQQFLALLARRVAGEPVAYLTGQCGFWSLDLQTSPATLIPRPDTELLVEQALRVMADKQQANVLDLGTGTGAIALALASEQPGWQITACDISSDAVKLACANRDRLGLSHVRIIESDWYAAIDGDDFDLVVSNPPYIDASDPHLSQGDVRFEPRTALVAGGHGFADIERVIAGAVQRTRPGGWLLFEHGYNQGEGARARLQECGFEALFTARDLAGHERVSGGCRPA